MRDNNLTDRPLLQPLGVWTLGSGLKAVDRRDPQGLWARVQRRSIAVLAPGLLMAGQLWLGSRPVQAQTAPGTVIENRATGSFIDTSPTSTGTPIEIQSNAVTVTVLEVAGIGIAAQTPSEATATAAATLLGGSAGPYQNIAGVQTGDVIYFDFVIENLGNDPTAFFIPNQPSSVLGGTFITGNLQIIAVDPDGAGTGYPAVIDFNTGTAGNQPFTVTTADDTIALLGATNGYIPPGGTVTVRVPVQVTETTIGNPIHVVLGNTGDNNNNASTQNQDVGTAPAGNDVLTQDLPNGTVNPYTAPATIPEANNPPVIEKEASAQGSATLSGAAGDYGDAPASYGTTIGTGGAIHQILATPNSLKIGATAPDSETDGIASATGNGDDQGGTDDEDPITFPTLQTNATSYSLDVTVTNSTGGNATLLAWIDFDQDGIFQADEGITVTVPTATAGPVTLTWSNIDGSGPDITDGDTFARFRLTTDTITTANATGFASNGEVEDHPLTIDLYTVPPGGPTLTCDPTFYIVIGSGGATGTSTVKTVTRSGTTYNFPDFTSATSNFTINALGYNPVDNYLYAMVVDSTNSSFPQGSVVRINATGALTNLGVPKQASTDGNDGVTLTSSLAGPNRTMNQMLPGSTPTINNTDFINVLDRTNPAQIPGGAFLAYGSNAGSYILSTAPVTFNSVSYTPIFLVDVTPATGPTFDFRGVVRGVFNDFFVNPQDSVNDRLYAIDESPSGNNRLVYFNPTSPSTAPTVVYSDLGAAAADGTNAGSQYADSFGTVYSRSGAALFYGINPTSGQAVELTGTATGGQHDGASCPTVQMEKKPNTRSVTAGATVTYTYRIANGRETALTVNFTDNLPTVTDYSPTTTSDESASPVNGTFVSGTAAVAAPATSSAPVLSNGNQTLTIPNLVLPARSITTITADVVIPSTAPNGTYFNQAQLTNVNTSDSALPATVLSDDPGDSFTGTDTVFKNFGDPTYLTVTAATSTTPNLLLAKRITALNGSSTGFTAVVDDPSTPNDNDGDWPSGFIQGALTATAVPGDVVDYTIYFLNTGSGAASNVKICDALSEFLTYIPNSYDPNSANNDGGGTTNLGIELNTGGSSVYMTGLSVDAPDRGALVDAGTAPANCVVEDPPGTFRAMTATDNPSGTVTVNLSSVAAAIGPGNPNTSYGYIRFRATVK